MAKVKRRLEVPQFFWMRVSMGLFIRETSKQRAKRYLIYINYIKVAVSVLLLRLYLIQEPCILNFFLLSL